MRKLIRELIKESMKFNPKKPLDREAIQIELGTHPEQLKRNSERWKKLSTEFYNVILRLYNLDTTGNLEDTVNFLVRYAWHEFDEDLETEEVEDIVLSMIESEELRISPIDNHVVPSLN